MGFMIPVAQYLSAEEALEYVCEALWSEDSTRNKDDDREQFGAGWYSRLSAPGYLDSTEWSGPYDSEEVALAECMAQYDVDENGDATDE